MPQPRADALVVNVGPVDLALASEQGLRVHKVLELEQNKRGVKFLMRSRQWN